jgi:peptidyl-prolyl cis-trans isomerase A (cyclophilin A)
VATPWLQGKHTIFGIVADDASRAVVDAIEAVDTDARDKPLTPVVIESVTVTEL